MSEYAGKIRATFASVFPDLLRAYADTAVSTAGEPLGGGGPAGLGAALGGDGGGAGPRHSPATIKACALRMMDALLAQVCVFG